MADVDMTDAPSNTAVASKRKGADAESKNDGKKRFEVKKVNTVPDTTLYGLPC
jgi:RING-box protein 1